MCDAPDGNELSGADKAPSVSLTELLQGTDAVGADFGLSINRSFVADSVAMPSADMLQSLFPGGASYPTAEVARLLADALVGPTSGLDALFAALPGDGPAPNLGVEAFASPAYTTWDGTNAAAAVEYFFTADALAVQADLAPLV